MKADLTIPIVACKWINGEFAQGTKDKDMWQDAKHFPLMIKEESRQANISNINNFVNLSTKKHNQETDHWQI